MYLQIVYLCICWIIKYFNCHWCTVQTWSTIGLADRSYPPTEKDTHATYGKILKCIIKEISPLNAQLHCNNCKLHLHVVAIQISHLQAVYIRSIKRKLYTPGLHRVTYGYWWDLGLTCNCYTQKSIYNIQINSIG